MAALLLGLPLVPAISTATSANHLDADTEGLENSLGRWAPWYSSSISRSTARAQSGTASLRVDVTAPYGWGVSLTNYPGFAATPGSKRISFWAAKGVVGTVSASLRVRWRNSSNADLATNTVSIGSLGARWSEAFADVVAPEGTTTVWVELAGLGASGDYLFVDDIAVATAGTAVPTTVPPTTAPQPVTMTTIPAPSGAAPTSPPAKMCGSTTLNGPSAPPLGTVPVYPGQDLSEATRAAASGTAFWLAPGRHTLSSSEFGQVIPKAGNTYIGAPGAILDGQYVNRYAFTQTASGVTIKYLTIQNFNAPNGEGVVNQGAASGWTIEYNTVTNNHGAGIFLGTDNLVRGNCVTYNGQYGFSMFRPQVSGASSIRNVTLEGNEIAYNNTDNWEQLYKQLHGPTAVCGCSGGGKFWDVQDATIRNNWVHDNRGVGLWADTNDIGFLFEGNYINDNDHEGILYEVSYNALIRNNTFKRNAIVKGQAFAREGNPFPVGAIYLSEAGGDARVSSQYATLEVTGNVFEDNWSGVVLWENANRFCNSPAHTSVGYCTRGGQASATVCVPAVINSEPYYSDCRWRTMNVWVHHNDFQLNLATLPGCATAVSCGKQALMSNWGTYPDWSPYKANSVQEAITFHQNNKFSDNRYVGDWSFMIYDVGKVVTFDQWRGAPYNQDTGSTKQ